MLLNFQLINSKICLCTIFRSQPNNAFCSTKEEKFRRANKKSIYSLKGKKVNAKATNLCPVIIINTSNNFLKFHTNLRSCSRVTIVSYSKEEVSLKNFAQLRYKFQHNSMRKRFGNLIPITNNFGVFQQNQGYKKEQNNSKKILNL